MKFEIPVGILLATVLSGCGVGVINHLSSGSEDSKTGLASGKHPITTRAFPVTSFSSIDAGSSFEIKFSVGKTPSVKVTAEDRLFSNIDVKVEGNELRLETHGTFQSNRPMKVEIVNPILDGIDLSGSANGTFSGLKAEGFKASLSGSAAGIVLGDLKRVDLELSGSSNLSLVTQSNYALSGTLDGSSQLSADGTINHLDLRTNGSSEVKAHLLSADRAIAHIEGSSTITASGSAKSLTIDAGGSSNAQMDSVTSESTNLSAEGASNIEVGETKSLRAEASGASHITYKGVPTQVSKFSQGASSIEKG